MPRTRYRFSDGRQPHFVTCTIVAWLPIFTRPEAAQIVLDSWRFLQDQGRIVLLGYVILENHLHWIAAADDLSKEVGNFKSYTARRLIELLEAAHADTLLEQLAYFKLRHKLDQEYQLWQEGSHPQEIANEESMRQKLEYIHNNPVQRGYVDDPLHWRYSSARNYARRPGLIDVCTEW
jgi:REP element-mobilizing transposase RayT